MTTEIPQIYLREQHKQYSQSWEFQQNDQEFDILFYRPNKQYLLLKMPDFNHYKMSS